MTRTARFLAAFLLAGLGLVLLPGVAWAQNFPWEFSASTDPLTDEVDGAVFSNHEDGGDLIFGCTKGKPVADFFSVKTTTPFAPSLAEQAEIAWRIDSGPVQREVWELEIAHGDTHIVQIFGRSAYEFALAAMRAKERIVFRSANHTVVFDTEGLTSGITQLLKLCGLPQ